MGKELDEYIASKQAASEENTEETTETTETEEVQTEETQEETAVEETAEETVEATETDFDDEQLNQFFETTGKTKDDIKSIYTLGGKYSEIEGKFNTATQELDSLKSSNEELKKGLDPLKHFSSENAYIAEQLRMKYPGMDPVAIQTAVTRDLSEVGDLDVLALQDTIKHPGASGGEAMAKRILADKYGVDLSEPVAEWDELAKAKIQRDAIDARTEIKTFQDEIELPITKSEDDLKLERAKQVTDLQEKWTPAMSEMTKFDKITIPGPGEGQVFEFEVPQSFRDGLPEHLNAMIIGGELEPGKETVKFLMEQRNKDFIYQNLGKIVESIQSDLRSDEQKKTDEELGNNDPANTQTKTPPGETISGTEKHLGTIPGRFRRT